jgi:hypothetical protein
LENPFANAADANAPVEVMELRLQSDLQDDLLACDKPERRRLASEYGISALDYMPEDVLLDEGELLCFVVSHLEQGGIC